MQGLLLAAIGIALTGICLMLFGIAFISTHPNSELPEWVKWVLLILAVSFIVLYSLMIIKIIMAMSGSSGPAPITFEGGIWI